MVGTRSTTPLRPDARQTRSAGTPVRVNYRLLNNSGQKQTKPNPAFENRFGASQLSLSPLEENINKINQSWNDDAYTDPKEKDEKGTEQEKEKEAEKEEEGGREEEEGGREEEEEEEREKDDAVGEKQKEKAAEKDVVRRMDFTEDDSFKQPVVHLSVSEDSSVLVLSNTPPGTEKSKEKTKCSSQKKKAVTTPRKGEGRLNWPLYTPFIHDAIIDLYVGEEDDNEEFTMVTDFYHGKVGMDEFFRDVAAAAMKNVVLEKEKRERDSEEKTAVKEEKTAVKEEKTAVKEEKTANLEQLRSYVQLAWDPTNITRRDPPDDVSVQRKQSRNFRMAMRGESALGTGMFGKKTYEDVQLKQKHESGQKDGPDMTKEAKLVRVMYPFFSKQLVWECHGHDCIMRDEEKRKGWPKPLTAKELKIEAKLKEKEAKKKRKIEETTRSAFKHRASQVDETNDDDGIWNEEEAEAEQPDPANGFGENSDLTVPRQRKRKRASSNSRGFICNPNGGDELEEKLNKVLDEAGQHAKAELEFKKESHKELMQQKQAEDDRKHEVLMASLNALTSSITAFASAFAGANAGKKSE